MPNVKGFIVDGQIIEYDYAGLANDPPLNPVEKGAAMTQPVGRDEDGRFWTTPGSAGQTEEVFWATYGTTTSAEIEAAYQAGKLCLATYGVAIYMLVTRVSATYHIFGSASTGGRLGFCLCNNNTWSVSNVPIPTKTSELQNDSGFITEVEDGSITEAKLDSNLKETVEEVGDLKSAIENLEAIPHSVKMAMDTLFSKAAYADADAASSYSTFHAWAMANSVTSITAVFTQGSATIYDTDSLDTLKQYLTVTANYSDSITAIVTDYTLSGTLAEGTSTITVAYGGKTTTFNVTVTGWNNYEYSMSNGQIDKIVGATSGAIPAIPGGIELDSNSTNRRSYPITKIGVRPYQEKTQSFADTIYYPIPIPADAVKAVVSITPSTQFHGESMYTYADGAYTRRLDPGWKQGSFTHSFTAGQYDYITIASKYNSAGSSYPEEPTEVSIQFLTE